MPCGWEYLGVNRGPGSHSPLLGLALGPRTQAPAVGTVSISLGRRITALPVHVCIARSRSVNLHQEDSDSSARVVPPARRQTKKRRVSHHSLACLPCFLFRPVRMGPLPASRPSPTICSALLCNEHKKTASPWVSFLILARFIISLSFTNHLILLLFLFSCAFVVRYHLLVVSFLAP